MAQEKQPKDLSIVIPCYNEAEAIPDVIPRVLAVAQDLNRRGKIGEWELLVVNDNSTDQSPELLSRHSPLEVIDNNDPDRGYGKALKIGFSKAKHDWIVFLDLDSSYRPECLQNLIDQQTAQDSKMVYGARPFFSSGMPLIRGLGNLFFLFLVKLMYRTNLTDVCSGYRLFHKSLVPEIVQLPENGLDFSLRLTIWSLEQQLPISKVDIRYDERSGESKLSSVKDGLRFLRVILSRVRWA